MVPSQLPMGLEVLADRPSIVPRGLIATGRALGIAAGGALALGAASLAWGSVERRLPVIRRFDVPISSGANFPAFKILHFSDLHLYPGQDFIVNFLHRVAREEEFDCVISTGDNFGAAEGLPLLTSAYEPFLSYPGAFVFGSNDYYSPEFKSWNRYLKSKASTEHPRHHDGPDLPWVDLATTLKSAGWADLSNDSDTIHIPLPFNSRGPSDDTPHSSGVSLSLIGTDDAHINRDRMRQVRSSWTEPNTLRVALTHAPYTRVLDAFTQLEADMIFAGHTHGGQIGLPFFGAIITNSDLHRRMAKGLHRYPTGSSSTWLHVSAGLGTSPFAPVRIATRPEVSILNIYPAELSQ